MKNVTMNLTLEELSRITHALIDYANNLKKNENDEILQEMRFSSIKAFNNINTLRQKMGLGYYLNPYKEVNLFGNERLNYFKWLEGAAK